MLDAGYHCYPGWLTTFASDVEKHRPPWLSSGWATRLLINGPYRSRIDLRQRHMLRDRARRECAAMTGWKVWKGNGGHIDGT